MSHPSASHSGDQPELGLWSADRYWLQERYLELTRELLPRQAARNSWPISEDHCFMRIVLDELFKDCWYAHLDRRRVAYKQLNNEQLQKAVAIAESLLNGDVRFVREMNQRSLRWRQSNREFR